MPKKIKKKVNKSTERSRADGSAAAASSLLAADKNNVQYLASPRKSDLDTNEYRVILLSNGLRVILIAVPKDDAAYEANVDTSKQADDESSKNRQKLREQYEDPEKKEAASCYLSINVGGMSNPRQIPGVSIILSSVLQLASLGDSEDSEYEMLDRDSTSKRLKIFLKESWEETRYHFSTGVENFREMLETFVQSIVNVAPTRDRVEMEWKRFQDPELVMLLSELRMFFHAETTFTNLITTRHPSRIASESDLARFGHISRDKLYMGVMKFRKRHYSANRMAVVLKAELPLDTLETYAIETFSKIPNNGLPPQKFAPYNFGNSFDNTKLPRIWIVPNDSDDSSLYKMQVHWIMPPSRWLYKVKSLEYLAWIFSTIGAGSLQDYLIQKNWAQKVIATIPNRNPWNTSLYSTFTITIDLSDEGNNHIINVLDAIYSYINLLKRKGPQQAIYDGIRINEEAKFRFGNDRDGANLSSMVENLHLYESADYISGPYLYCEYDPVSITTCMELMAPAKGCVFMNNDKFLLPFKTKKSRIENSPGKSYEFPEELIERWKTIAPLPEFKLPEANKFWPDDFSIIDPPERYTKNPSIVYSDAISKVWYKFDPSVRAPMCHMSLCYSSPLPLESAENSVMLTFFAKVLQTLICNETELAERAGLSSSVEVRSSKLVITIRGFRQKLPLLMETIARYVHESHFRLTNKLFQFVRFTSYEEYARILSEPRELAGNIRESILMPGCWIAMDNYKALLAITFAKFRDFVEKFTNDVDIKCLVQGNVSESMAVETARRAVKLSKCKISTSRTMPQRLINEIPPGTRLCKIKIGKTCDECSSRYLINYYQFDDSTIERAVLIDALMILFHDFRFSKLRCVVTGTNAPRDVGKDDFGVDNYNFGVDGRENRSNDIEKIQLLDKHSFKRFTSALTDFVWGRLKSVLLKKAIRNSRNDFEHNWNEIIHGECDFDRYSRQIDAIAKLKAGNFVDFLTQLAKDASGFRKLSIMVIGNKTEWITGKKINSLNYKFRLGNFNKFPSLRFEYLTESGKENGKTSDHYITDVAKYKNELERLL